MRESAIESQAPASADTLAADLGAPMSHGTLRSWFASGAVMSVLAAGWMGVSAFAQEKPQTVPPYAMRPAAASGTAMWSIPAESMLPALQVGDRVLAVLGIYDAQHLPKRGDVLVFKHPHAPKAMIKRVVGLPGDTVQMRRGRLWLNGKEIPRTKVRAITYIQGDRAAMLATATEYEEQLPGEAKTHLIHEFTDDGRLDGTPLFRVPAGHLFLMGDNRDNSEDSRAPSGHRALAAKFPQAWNGGLYLGDPRDDAMGFVALEHVMGRATRVVLSLSFCNLDAAQKAEGIECFPSRIGKPL